MPNHAEAKRNQPPLGHLKKRRVSSHFSKCGIARFDLHANATRIKDHKRVLQRHGHWGFIYGR